MQDITSLDNLISINEAAKKGIERLRKTIWANKEDHLKIDIINNKPGPWLHLYAPFNKECNGKDPVNIIFLDIDCDSKDWIPHLGPLPNSVEYTKKVESFAGCLGNINNKGD